MGKSLDAKAKSGELKALQVLVDGLGDDDNDTDGVVTIFELEKEGVFRTVEQLARDGYAKRTTRWAVLARQEVPAYVITETGVRHYYQMLEH